MLRLFGAPLWAVQQAVQQTEEKIQEVFPMFKMSVDGMNDAMRRLMVAK